MSFLQRWAKCIVPLVIIAFVNLSMPISPALAAMVGTESIVSPEASQINRSRVLALLDREEVRMKLQELGIAVEEAKARVDSLTEDELARVTASLDTLPAGGDMGFVGAVVLIFVILIMTDILGLTHIFPAISGKK